MVNSPDTGRRRFLADMLGVAAMAVFPAPAAARAAAAAGQSIHSYKFEPDAKISLAGRPVLVDLGLLGDNGEMTAGFLAALDTTHGPPFGPGWKMLYGYLKDVRTTDEGLIRHVTNHLKLHHIGEREIRDVRALAQRVWQKRPDLRYRPPGPPQPSF